MHRQESGTHLSRGESRWWLELVACPCCGAEARDLRRTSEVITGCCRVCGRRYSVNGHILSWQGDDEVGEPSKVARPGLWEKLRNSLNPLNNPLLPMRHLSRWRVEQYYRRTLTDVELARSFARNFLGGLNLPSESRVLDFGCGRGRNIGLPMPSGPGREASRMSAGMWSDQSTRGCSVNCSRCWKTCRWRGPGAPRMATTT